MVPVGFYRRYGYMAGRKSAKQKPNRISEHRTRLELNQTQLGEKMGGVHWTTISSLENGKQKLTQEWMERFAAAMDLRPADMLLSDNVEPGTVPLVGFVSAGAEATIWQDAQGVLDRVPAPMNATTETVAVEIRGDSLGKIFDGWLAYYDDVRTPPTAEMMNKLCIVQLEDGRTMAKAISLSSEPDHFNLSSPNIEPIYTQRIAWAALVTDMKARR